MKVIEIFHPEMYETAHKQAQLIVERLYKKSKVTCLNGIVLVENRSIEFKTCKNGNNVYYATDAAIRKLEKHFNIS